MEIHRKLIDKLKPSWFLVVLIATAFTPVFAEDLTGTDRFMCAPSKVNICGADGSCVSALPWEVNVPQFIIVDLDEQMLATTEASDRPRATPIKTMSRDADTIFLQGLENGRAFSFAINEKTGFMTVAVARDFLTVTGSGVCTPIK
ncbi:MAG: hypothetical protein ACR2QG_12590 [Gammaproteobacteria bacterium]